MRHLWQHDQATVGFTGDSITRSLGDTVNGPPEGVHAGSGADRAPNNTVGLVSAARHAERGDQFYFAALNRHGLLFSCSRILEAYGNNDLYTVTTSPAIR